MEEFYQYIGPDNGAATSFALLNHERLFVYSSPCEKPIDRCGEVRVGSYFACSAVLYYDDQVWLKIRRGYFSNAKNNGYIRVYFDFSTGSHHPVDGQDLPRRQQTSVVDPHPAPFRHLRRLPEFPTYMCARDRLELHREPVFTLHSASVSSASSNSTPRHLQRFIPPMSVFHATECSFNQDFSQLAFKVTSSLAGITGWVNASFAQSLIPVEDPHKLGYFQNGPIYMQNVAARGGKWDGALPIRALPSLQAPRVNHVEHYRIVRAIERKLIKDRVWIRIEPHEMEKTMMKKKDEMPESDDNQQEEREQFETESVGPDAWIIERNANTADRVMVPWGRNEIQDVPSNDEAERYYRTVYTRRPLPLRRTADLQAEIVGHLEPGSVFSSTHRALNSMGQMWIRVVVPREKEVKKGGKEEQHGEEDGVSNNNVDESKEEEEEEEEDELDDRDMSVRYGYVIQSNAKTNACMVQEVPAPGKMNPKQYYRVVLASESASLKTNGSNQDEASTTSIPPQTLAARSEASSAGKVLFYVRNGAILSAIGSVYNAHEKRMWLQVLATELEPLMRVKPEQVVSEMEANLNVVYLPLSDSSPNVREPVIQPLYRTLSRLENPLKTEKEAPSRIVFTGRASKLFGSHLLRPSTIDLPSMLPKKEDNNKRGGAVLSSGLIVSESGADGAKDPTQTFKEEFTAWQLQTSTWMTQWYSQLGFLATYTLSCVRKPFASCLAHQEAKRRYRQLEQDGEGMEEYALEDDEEQV